MAFFSLMIAYPLGIFLGIISAVRQDRMFDHVSRFFAIAFVSLPIFWFAMCFVAGLISWIILVTNFGGLFGPKQSLAKAFGTVDDETVIISAKVTAIGLFTFWAGYAPAAAKYDDASVVIILLTGFLALAYALKMKEKKSLIFLKK